MAGSQTGAGHLHSSTGPSGLPGPSIAAHTDGAVDHIELIGAVISGKGAGTLVILDTVNPLTNRSPLSSYFLLGLLSSPLLNWYVYRFIFAKAIRTLYFD